MRVAQLIARHCFHIVEAPPPEPGPGEVLVRVHSVGICGSDLHNFSEGSVGDTPSVFPMVLGHEPTGVVVRTGRDVSGIAPGDRAILEPAVYCYHCEMCRRGRHNLCEQMRFLSASGEPGFFRDLVTLPASNLLPLPEGMGFAEGTLFEPLAVALHSMAWVRLAPGETAAVFGCGPIGVLTIAVLKMHGARRVFAVDPVAHRREMGLAFGADAVLDPSEAVAAIRAGTQGRGVDVAIDCVTRGGSLDQCCLTVARGGRVVVTGIPSDAMPAIHFHELRRKEAPLYTVRRSNHETPIAMDLLRERPSLFGPLVTHLRPLEEVEAAFSMVENYAEGVGKAVIEVSS